MAKQLRLNQMLSLAIVLAGGGWSNLFCCAQTPEFAAENVAELPVKSAVDGPIATIDDVESVELQLAPLAAHLASPVITALAASHDGRFLAAAGDDHAIRIVDVRSGTTFSTLVGHQDWIQSLVFSADSQQLFSAGNDGRILRWNHRYPVSFTEIQRFDFAIRSISLSTTKNLLAVGGFSNEVTVLDLDNDRIKHRLACDSEDQRCVRFSPDGTKLLRGGRLGEVCVWDTETGQELARYRHHRRRVFTAAFSVDGSQVTSVGEDRRIVRYDIPTGQMVSSEEIANTKLMSMCLINDSVVAAAGADNSIHLVDLRANELVAQLKGHSGTVAVMVPCGNFLASGGFDTTIRIWNLERIAERQVNYGKPVLAPLKMDTSLQIR